MVGNSTPQRSRSTIDPTRAVDTGALSSDQRGNKAERTADVIESIPHRKACRHNPQIPKTRRVEHASCTAGFLRKGVQISLPVKEAGRGGDVGRNGLEVNRHKKQKRETRNRSLYRTTPRAARLEVSLPLRTSPRGPMAPKSENN